MAKLSEFNKDRELKDGRESINEKDIKDKFDQYKYMSQGQLNQELFKEVARQKSNGTFDYGQLAMMLENIRSSLSEEQYQNMKRILETLK